MLPADIPHTLISVLRAVLRRDTPAAMLLRLRWNM